ncbi:putative membrane-bound spermidine synthase [Nocardia transvalensis]|uniref:Putative membrane-bound spermidine synthase n=1 Tax=Nocardia transvalensis TaxID=37333 RepID=A0A7W9PKY8_9NOCA|nr:hypothetical protein [Nocardia transvalensis]MBB5918037.1 putative membrane-bound spermidine synthase [Nocardia transvalensis]
MYTIALLGSSCFICYLALCALVVLRTGATSGLRDVAWAVNGILHLRQVN